MNNTIIQRIEQVRRGEVPDGYVAKLGYCFPIGWHIRKLRDGFSRLTKKNTEKCKNVLTISAQQGLISQQEYYNHSYASENTQGYYLLKKGDYAYNKSYSDGYPFGAIKRLEKYEKGIVSPLYICFSPNVDTNSNYYSHYFEAGVFNREIYSIAQEGARNHGLLNVAVEDFFDGYILSPPIAEQQKIAKILMQLDKVITRKKELLNEKRKQKKWLMHNLLNPNSGVRLPGLAGKWKKTSLDEICTVVGGGTPNTKNADYWTGNIPWISSSDINEHDIHTINVSRYITKEAVANSATQVCPKDTILIVSRVGVGKVAVAPFALCTSQDFTNLMCVQDNIFFTSMLLTQAIAQKLNYLQGTSIKGITVKEIKTIKLQFPPIPEQIAIANVLSTADKEIDLLEQELASWKEKKKELAQLLLTGLVRV